MKKFALLFSSFAFVATAVAVQPERNASLPAVQRLASQKVQLMSGQYDLAKIRVDQNAPVRKYVKKAPTKLTVGYEEPQGLFALGLTEDLYGFQTLSMRKGPAYTPLKWTNMTVGAKEYEWEYAEFVNGESVFGYSSDVDLVKPETYSAISAPTLYAVDEAGNEDSYQINPEQIQYFFGGGCDGIMQNGNPGMTSYLYGYQGGFTGVSCLSYNANGKANDGFNPSTGLYSVFTDTENGIGLKDPQFVGYGNVFDTPAAPYVITKMWSWLIIRAQKATTIEMTFYRIDEDGRITDEILAQGTANVAPSSKEDEGTIAFDMYSIDEDGLQTDDPIVIDSAFIAVMRFNKDDIVSVTPVSGAGAIYPVNDDSNYTRNALIVLNVEGDEVYYYSPYSYYTDNSHKELFDITDFMWMMDAVFPWSYVTEDKTSVHVANEGGNAVFNIQSYYNMGSVPVEVSDNAEWLDLENATIADGADNAQVLTVPVAALPADVKGRSATLTFDAPAAPLTLTISQGEGAGVEVVVEEGAAIYYDLSGRRVVNPDKGLYIKVNGNKAEKVIL